MATKGPRLVCTVCGEPPAVYSLIENDGTIVDCECDPEYKCISQDAMPYEIGVSDLPDRWVVEGSEDDDRPDPGPNETLTEMT